MKKKLSIIMPSIIIFVITLWGRGDKNIIVGIYLLYPIIFIVQGYMYSYLIKQLLIGLVLSSIAFIVPINLWFNMGSCIDLLIIYNILAIVSFLIKNKTSILRKNTNIQNK